MTEFSLNLKTGFSNSKLVSDLELENLDIVILYKTDYTEMAKYILLDKVSLIFLNLKDLVVVDIANIEKLYSVYNTIIAKKGNPASINLKLVEEDRNTPVTPEYDSKFTLYRSNKDLYIKLDNNQFNSKFTNLSNPTGVLSFAQFSKIVIDTKYSGYVTFSDNSPTTSFNLSISKYVEIINNKNVEKIELPPIDDKDIIKVSSVSIKSTTDNKIKYSIFPSNATNRLVSFSTNTPNILNIDENGVYKFKDYGTAEVVVTSLENDKVSVKSKITSNLFYLYKASVDQKNLVVSGSGTPNLPVILEYGAAIYETKTDIDGKFSIKLNRSNSIKYLEVYLKSNDKTLKSNNLFLNVDSMIESVKFDKNTITTNINTTGNINVTVSPSDTKYRNGKFISSDTNIVSITQDGVWSARNTGSATITWVSDTDSSIKASANINVKANLKSFTLQSTETLVLGQTNRIIPTLYWENNIVGEYQIKYTSNDTSIATVDTTGTIKTLKAGVTSITVEISGMSKVLNLTVKNKPASLDITANKDTVYLGKQLNLSVNVVPSEYLVDYELKWSCSNINLAIVESDGTFVPLNVGTVDITASIPKYNIYSLKTIKILPTPKDILSIDIAGDIFRNMYVGDTDKLKYSYMPLDIDIDNISISSSNEKVAIVKDNTIIALSAGSTQISVYDNTNTSVYKSITVMVKEKDIDVESIEVISNLELTQDDTYKLNVKVLPENATNKAVKYSIEDTSIISIDSMNTITALSAGSTILEVSDSSSTLHYVCNVKVLSNDFITFVEYPEVQYDTIYGEDLAIKISCGSSKGNTLNYELLDSDKNVIKTSSNGLFNVNSKDIYSMNNEFTIKVYTLENSVTTDTFKINIKDKYDVKFKLDEVSLNKGETLLLDFDIIKNDLPYSSDVLNWESSDNNIASVNYDGTIKAKNVGTSTIVLTVDSIGTDSIAVTVNEPTEEESSSETSEDEPTESL